jgi:predicted RNase H-like HicB family nuclease
MRYLVVVEEGPMSFGAYVPDLPGCIAAAETREEALALIREAIAFHLQGLQENGQPIRTRRPRRKSSKSTPPEAGITTCYDGPLEGRRE